MVELHIDRTLEDFDSVFGAENRFFTKAVDQALHQHKGRLTVSVREARRRPRRGQIIVICRHESAFDTGESSSTPCRQRLRNPVNDDRAYTDHPSITTMYNNNGQ